jgi:hypothetical protein
MKKYLVLGLVLCALVITPVFAQSTLTAEQIIQALMANPVLIQQIQAFLAGGNINPPTTATTTPPVICPPSYVFTRDLNIGSTGADVLALQKILVSKGFLPATSATGFFGYMTQMALTKYQTSVGLRPTGYLDLATRTYLNNSNGCNQSAITVLSPNGGESWQKGFYQAIKWSNGSQLTPSVYPGSVKIELLPYSSNCIGPTCSTTSYVIAQNAPNNSVFWWSVGKVQQGTTPDAIVIPDGAYQIRICPIGLSTIMACDTSDNYFKIYSGQPGGYITPSTISNMEVGKYRFERLAVQGLSTDRPISWKISAGVLPQGLVLYPSTSGYAMIAGTPKVAEMAKFTVQATNGIQTAEQTYVVTVGGTITTPSVVVVSPNGGESWQKGSSQVIKWLNASTSAISIYPGSVRIELWPYNNSICTGTYCPTIAPYIITQNAPNSSAFWWSVGKVQQGTASDAVNVPDGAYQVKICPINTIASTACDMSDSYFKIYSNPTGGASLTVQPNPSLGMKYDPSNSEASLVANFQVSVTNNSTEAVYLYKRQTPVQLTNTTDSNSNHSPYGRILASDLLTSAVGSYVVDGGDVWGIPAGQTASFVMQTSFDPKSMFAGTYKAGLDRLIKRVDWTKTPNEPNYISGQIVYTNLVTIVGEKSPYIDSITSPVDVNGTVTIKGSRFATVGNIVSIMNSNGGILPSFKLDSPYTTSLTFVPSQKGIPASNLNYLLDVLNPSTGLSNRVGLSVTGTSTSSLAVMYPKGGENMVSGDEIFVQWTPIVPVSTIDIVSTAGNYSVGIYGPKYGNPYPITSGNFTSRVPSGIPAGTYYVKITPANGSSQAISRIFSINQINQSSITILSPKGGEVWHPGERQVITWNSNGINGADKVLVEIFSPTYSLNLNSNVYTVVKDGRLEFSLPLSIPSGTNYRVKVTDVANYSSLSPYGLSNYFTIASGVAQPIWTMVSAPTPIVTASPYPGAGSTLTAGLTFRVQTASGNVLNRPTIADFVVGFASSSSNKFLRANYDRGAVALIDSISPTDVTISNGGSYTITLRGILSSSNADGTRNLTTSGVYYMAIKQAAATINNQRIITITGLDSFRTPGAYLPVDLPPPPPSPITVLSPNGGETYNNTSILRATYHSSVDVTVASLMKGGISRCSYSMGTNVGYVDFSLSSCLGGATGSDFKVRVSSYNGSYDESDGYFNIVGPIVPPPPTNFSVSLSPISTITVAKGGSAAASVTASLVSGTSSPINLRFYNLPAGIIGSITPSSCSPTCSATLTLSASPDATAGNFGSSVQALGSSGNVIAVSGFSLKVLDMASTTPSGLGQVSRLNLAALIQALSKLLGR